MLEGKVRPEFEDKTHLAQKLSGLLNEIRQQPIESISQRTGIKLTTVENHTVLEFHFLDSLLWLTSPENDLVDANSRKPIGLFQKVLIMHYLCQSDGYPLESRWISFSELPSGNFYSRAFEGYTGKEIEKVFSGKEEQFAEACEGLGGIRESFGDVAYSFDILPNIKLMAVCWVGDEDFPTSFKILFDGAVFHHITTDGCAILGSMLTKKIIGHRRRFE